MNFFKNIYKKYFQTKKSKIKELLNFWEKTFNTSNKSGSIFAYTSKGKYYIVLIHKTFSVELIYDNIHDASNCLFNSVKSLVETPELFEIIVIKTGKEIFPYKNQRNDFFPNDIELNPDDYYPLDENDF